MLRVSEEGAVPTDTPVQDNTSVERSEQPDGPLPGKDSLQKLQIPIHIPDSQQSDFHHTDENVTLQPDQDPIPISAEVCEETAPSTKENGDHHDAEQNTDRLAATDEEKVETPTSLSEDVPDIEIFHQLKDEQAAQVQEVETTRKALMDLQRKRLQLEYIRSTLVSVLESGNLDELVSLNEQIDKLDDGDEKKDILSLLRDGKEAGTPEYQSRQEEVPAIFGSSCKEQSDEFPDDASVNEIMEAIGTIPKSDIENDPMLMELVRLKEVHDARDNQLQQLQRLKEQYEQNQRTAQSQLDVFAQRENELQELQIQFNAVNAIMNRTQRAERQHRETMTGANTEREIVGNRDQEDKDEQTESYSEQSLRADYSQIAAFREELRELEALKAALDARRASFGGQIASSSAQSFSAEDDIIDHCTDETRPREGRIEENLANQYAEGLPNGVEDLMRRLIAASVRERLEQPSVSRETAGESNEELNTHLKAPSFQLQAPLRENTSSPFNGSNASRAITNLSTRAYAGSESQGQRIYEFEEGTDNLDEEKLTIGMEEVLTQMHAIQKARDLATGARKQQFNELFGRLQKQLEELQNVQKNVAYFRRLVGEHVSKSQFAPRQSVQSRVTMSPERVRWETPEAFEEFSHQQPNVEANVPSSVRSQRYDSLQFSPGQFSQKRMRSPLRRESEYRDERNASWVEHAEVDEYDIDSQADEEVEDDKDDEAAVKTDPRAKRLFEQCKDKIYRGAANLIAQNESEPYFLLQLFRGAEQLDTTYLRQRLMIALDEIVEEAESIKNEKENAKENGDRAMNASMASGNAEREQRRRRRSAAPSPSPNISIQRNVMDSRPVTANSRLSSGLGYSLDEKPQHGTHMHVQSTLINYVAHISTPEITRENLIEIKAIVEIALDRRSGKMPEGVMGVLDKVLKKYLGANVVDVGGMLVGDIIEFMDIAGPEYETSAYPSESQTPQKMPLHLADECPGEQCQYDHIVLDGLLIEKAGERTENPDARKRHSGVSQTDDDREDTLDVPTGDNEIQNRADSAATVVAVGDRRTSADNAKSEK